MTDTLQLDDSDIEFGDAVYDEAKSTWTFDPNTSSAAPYAIRVTVRRDGVMNPLVPRFFAKVLGIADGVQSATSAAMITPRDIALVVDLSRSMTYDSMLIHRNKTQINLRDVWVTLEGPASSPETKIVDGKEYVVNYALREPGVSAYANDTGRAFGSMTDWGTEMIQGLYNEPEMQVDPGMFFLPQRSYTPTSAGWTDTLGGVNSPQYILLVTDLTNPRSLKSRGHSDTQITNLLKRPSSESSSTYRARVKVVLGLADWNDTGDNVVQSSEVTTVVDQTYAIGASWDNWIDDIRNKRGITYYSSKGGGSFFRHYFGLKTYVNWLMDRQFAKTGPASGSSGYTPNLQLTVAEPLQATKDAVNDFAEYLLEVESNDLVGLVVYGTNGAVDPFSETNGLTNDFSVIGDLPYPHQAAEQGLYTNTAEALLRGYIMVNKTNSRPYAHKVIVFMSDGYTTAYNGFNVVADLESPATINTLGAVTDVDSLEQLFGGVPSGSVSTGGSAGENGRLETLAIADILASNLLGLGDVEFNVVGVGADADIQNLLQPIAAASGGEAYHAVPDVNDPAALQQILRQIYRDIGGKRPVALIHPGTPPPASSNSNQNGNNGVGNGEDPAPPGSPPVNDGAGTGPGNPGNQGGPG